MAKRRLSFLSNLTTIRPTIEFRDSGQPFRVFPSRRAAGRAIAGALEPVDFVTRSPTECSAGTVLPLSHQVPAAISPSERRSEMNDKINKKDYK